MGAKENETCDEDTRACAPRSFLYPRYFHAPAICGQVLVYLKLTVTVTLSSTIAAIGRTSNTELTAAQTSSPKSGPNFCMHSLP